MVQIGPYLLRPADNRDGPAVWKLINDILASYGLEMDARTIDKDLTDIEAHYWEQKGAFFVLLDRDQVIGTVALQYEAGALCELCRMYLHADYRGKGVGRALLDYAQAVARRLDAVRYFFKPHRSLKKPLHCIPGPDSSTS